MGAQWQIPLGLTQPSEPFCGGSNLQTPLGLTQPSEPFCGDSNLQTPLGLAQPLEPFCGGSNLNLTPSVTITVSGLAPSDPCCLGPYSSLIPHDLFP